MDFIHRHIEDIVLKTESTFKGVLLTGARQTGKSTLLQELFPDKRYVAIDDPFETYDITEILKSYSNRGLDYRHFVSYYRGKDKKKIKADGVEIAVESEIDFIIEENGVLYPIEIKQASNVTADMTSAFTVLDKIPDKKRGTGAVVCMCPQPGVLRENILVLPVWYL